jgi:hypothetical protein
MPPAPLLPPAPVVPPHREPAPWTLSGCDAVATAVNTRIDLAEAPLGLAVADGLQVLGLLLPEGCRPVEAWQRGTDLTAVYEPQDDRQLRITAMWRLGAAASGSATRSWQMVLSSQTSLLTSTAELTVISTINGVHSNEHGRWAGDSVAWEIEHELPATCLRVRQATPDGVGRCVLIAIHPDDPGAITTERRDNGSEQVACRLFPSDVEKGVLLRSRVLVAVGTDEATLEASDGWSADLLRQFAGSPPVLTA